MSRIEKGGVLDTNLHGDAGLEKEKVVKKEIIIPPFAELKMPSRDVRVPTPPFWGRRVMEVGKDFKLELAFDWINHKILFKQRWGYNSKGMDKDAYEKQLEEKVWPAYERIKKTILRLKLV